MNKLGRSVIATLLLGGALALAGCAQEDTTTTGSGTPGVFGTGGGGGGGGVAPPPPPPPPPVAGAPSLVLTLADPTTGATTTSAPATARAIVRDAAGVGVPSVVVTFTTNTALGTLIPASGTALTDATGTATVGLTAASLTAAGAATLTATSQVGTTAVTGSIGYSVGASNVTITNFTFGVGGAGQPPLSAFGTTSVSVTVNSNGVPVTSPQTVTFSSPCAGSGKAVLTPSVLTGASGVAIASYRDNGCGGTDVVTASVSGIANASSTLTVAAPTTGSIQFISATPTSITLKGTGGAGRQESSQVIFKVVDTGGNPIGGKTVDFSLSTSLGGITFANGLITSSAISDATTGQAVVTVNSGTISTPVRVLASTPGAVAGVTLTTQSDQLTITTGIPDQDSFSVSATKLNIEGLNFDGETTVLTARLSDHFSNPAPDGTAVNFIAEGGQMVSSCSTVNGACDATMTSAAFRPLNGRVTVLAFAVGEESFTDLDADGLADHTPLTLATDEMIDANNASTDMAEAFVDYNENGIRDAIGAGPALEPFIDFNSNGTFDPADGKYNGVLCNETAPAPGPSFSGTCAASKSIHVRRNFPIVFSGSDAVIRFFDSTKNPINPATGIVFAPCDATDPIPFTPETLDVLVTITDVNGNIMPVGTNVVFDTTNGTIVSTPKSFVVPNSTACLNMSGPGFFATGTALSGFVCPGSNATVTNIVSPAVPVGNPPLTYTVKIKSQATQSGTSGSFTCNNPANSPGVFSVTVTTTPKAVVTTNSITVKN